MSSSDPLKEFGAASFVPPNILCREGSFASSLGIEAQEGDLRSFFVLQKSTYLENEDTVGNFWELYQSDPEYEGVNQFFHQEHRRKSFLFKEETNETPANLPSRNFRRGASSRRREEDKQTYHHLLRLPNTTADVRLRQEGVRELALDDRLFDYFTRWLTSANYPEITAISRDRKLDLSLEGFYTPAETKSLLESLAGLREMRPQSESLIRLGEWGAELQDDSVIQEMLRTRRKITDSRIFMVFSERHGGARYGILKPGIKAEDVFDMLAVEGSRYEVVKGRLGKEKIESRNVANFKGREDEEFARLVVAHARQRMDVLNEVSSRLVTIPATLAVLQAKHLYQGAYIYRKLREAGYPMSFPEIADDKGILEVEGLYPIRLVLDKSIERENMATNSFSFSTGDRVIQAEGPNKRGKSEAWRSLHLTRALVNAGYPVPCTKIRSGIMYGSNFISCKGNRGYGGSELERGLKGVVTDLGKVHEDSEVILDELGDSTNAPTSLEIAKRLIPVLLERRCRVYITSHHPSLSSYIQSLGGRLFMPDKTATGVSRYRLVSSDGEADFRAQETLDSMGFTQETLRGCKPTSSRSILDKTAAQEMREDEQHDSMHGW